MSDQDRRDVEDWLQGQGRIVLGVTALVAVVVIAWQLVTGYF